MKRLLVVEDKADNLRHIAHALRLFVGRELRMAELEERVA
jgi:CheY-like chemotaxis protein